MNLIEGKGRGRKGGRKNVGDIREAQEGTVAPFWKGSHGELQLKHELNLKGDSNPQDALLFKMAALEKLTQAEEISGLWLCLCGAFTRTQTPEGRCCCLFCSLLQPQHIK